MHPQDVLLVAEALVAYAGDSRDPSARERRVWELAEALVADEGTSMDALVSQVNEG